MAYDPYRHHRRSIRLKGYDYSQPGHYFVTICTQHRLCLYGDVVNEEMILNAPGNMVEAAWRDLPNRFPALALDEHVVMPNHFHGIFVIQAIRQPVTAVPLGRMVGAFKSITTHAYMEGVKQQGWPSFYGRLWQRDFYDHIVRNETDLNRIRAYIRNNPANWNRDIDNSANKEFGLRSERYDRIAANLEND